MTIRALCTSLASALLLQACAAGVSVGPDGVSTHASMPGMKAETRVDGRGASTNASMGKSSAQASATRDGACTAARSPGAQAQAEARRGDKSACVNPR